MATRRKGKQATRGSSRSAWPVWVWVGLGMLLGIGLMLVVLGKDWAPLLRKQNLPQPNPEATAPRAGDAGIADDGKGKPRKTYDFYQVLPEKEVVIPDAELTARARAEQQAKAAQAQQPTTPSTTPAAPGSTRYMLQTGSYPDARAADEVKAKLALLGFVAQVQPVSINGKTWNRVRLGPYPSASELEDAKRALADNGINAIALKENAQ